MSLPPDIDPDDEQEQTERLRAEAEISRVQLPEPFHLEGWVPYPRDQFATELVIRICQGDAAKLKAIYWVIEQAFSHGGE